MPEPDTKSKMDCLSLLNNELQMKLLKDQLVSEVQEKQAPDIRHWKDSILQ